MKAYSTDLRQRVIAAYDAREGTQDQVAVRFSVSVSWVRKLLRQRRHTGSIEPKPHGGGRAPAFGGGGRPPPPGGGKGRNGGPLGEFGRGGGGGVRGPGRLPGFGPVG